MQYNYETLTPDRFQELCQALVTHSYPSAQSFPVGKKDGGRDALAEGTAGEAIVFQVKFRRTAESPTSAAALVIAAFDAELPKIKRLHARGSTHYVLITNLSATAGLDTGERDRVQAHVDAASPMPTSVWWREDVDARLNDAYDIKWAFSEVITSADLLRKLIEEGFAEPQIRRNSAITAYLTAQYAFDEFVKFKQADLQASDLLTLFIDVPATLQRGADTQRDFTAGRAMQVLFDELQNSNPQLTSRHRRLGRDIAIGAATLLLSAVGQQGLDSVVLEGGPGQGKSTLAQYICQAHRIRILGKTDKLERLPAEHRYSPIRVPFKVDLRDLASWLRRVDPFNGNAALPSDITASLESFLAAQIKHLSGGQSFSVDDMRLFFRQIPALLVLDGLDEVAVMSDRREVIEAITAARSRLTATAASVQMLITSRPAATASTPRLSDTEWRFLSLTSITEDLIFDYTERWGTARRLDALDLAELREILKAKLSSPHIMDLSRNAMQLTILLQLMHSRGSALPDQRTQLYDLYVDILFNREADKNRVVRDNRQLLIDLHGYVAWRMHGAAQSKRANGRVSEQELREMMSEYLCSSGHADVVVEDLFAGVVQRVVALVSRTQGTFEFEVQPLREYFAGRHLYNTAPSSPVGNPQRGTKLDIFEALSRQPYWLNVTRFYAGCYSIGELAGLASQLEELIEDRRAGRTSFARGIATSLLGDRVFQQSPKITSRVVQLAADPLTIRYAFIRLLASEGLGIDMPSDCGRTEFLELVARRAMPYVSAPIRLESSLLAQESFTQEELFHAWLDMKPGLDDDASDLERWVEAGNRLGTTAVLEESEAARLAASGPRLRRLLALGGSPGILRSPEMQGLLFTEALDGRIPGVRDAGALGWALRVLDARRLDWQYDLPYGASPQPSDHRHTIVADDKIADLATDVARLLRQREHISGVWQEVARRTERAVGRCWFAWGSAILASTIPNQSESQAEVDEPGKDVNDVLSAVALARSQTSAGWWEESLKAGTDSLVARAHVAMSVLWSSPALLKRLMPFLEAQVEQMSPGDYATLAGFLLARRRGVSRRRIPTRVSTGICRSSKSLRTRVLIASRGTDEFMKTVLREATVEVATTDPFLMRMILDERIEQIAEGSGIESALRDVVLSYPLAGEAVIFNYGQPVTLEEKWAHQVLDSPDLYPPALIKAADVSLSALAVGSQGIARIASRQKWSAG